MPGTQVTLATLVALLTSGTAQYRNSSRSLQKGRTHATGVRLYQSERRRRLTAGGTATSQRALPYHRPQPGCGAAI